MHSLNSFSSYFEICFALSAGYTGFKFVREYLNKNIFKLNSELFSSIAITIKEVRVESKTINPDEDIKKETEISKRYLNYCKNTLEKKELKARKFLDDFKLLFFLSTLYCLTAIVISGISSYFPKSYIVCKTIIYFTAVGISILQIILFVLSLNKKTNRLKISPFIIFCLFTSVLIISCLLVFLFDLCSIFRLQYNLLIVLLAGFFAFILLLLRAYIHRRYFKFKEQEILKKSNSRIKLIQNHITEFVKTYPNFSKKR